MRERRRKTVAGWKLFPPSNRPVLGRYPEIMPADVPHFPPVPHRTAGVDCDGSVVPEQDGENVMLKCNVCAVMVGTVNAKILEALEQAIADDFVFHKFD